MKTLIAFFFLSAVSQAFHLEAHQPTDASELKRGLAFASGAFYLGHHETFSVFLPAHLSSSKSSLVFRTFGNPVVVEILQILNTANATQVLVHAVQETYYPISYLYRVDISNSSALHVINFFPVTTASLTSPIMSYLSFGGEEFIVSINDFREVLVFTLSSKSLELIQTITTIGTMAFRPYSISIVDSTVFIADLTNGLLVYQFNQNGLNLTQHIDTLTPATSVFAVGTTVYIGTLLYILEYTQDETGSYELSYTYDLETQGLYPYYLFATADVLGYQQYASKSNSPIYVVGRNNNTLITSHKTRFEPFLINNTVVYQKKQGSIVTYQF